MSLLLALLLILQETDSQSPPAAPTPTVISGPLTMAASTEKKILVVRIGPYDVKKYDIAVGMKAHPTPMGRFVVRHMIWNPAWTPPNAGWARGKQPTPPGHPKNPMRAVKIFFNEPDYYIHGTNQEDSIGYAASHGCIRMTEADATDLGRYLMTHTGLEKDDDWFANVFSSDKQTDVRLPHGVSFAIGR
jgi:L,D-transpeptidase ErfK/SrfK